MKLDVYQSSNGSKSTSVLVPNGTPFPAIAQNVLKDPELVRTIELDPGTPRVAIDVPHVLEQIASRGFAVVGYVVKVTERTLR